MNTPAYCPCGSSKRYADCCAPYIAGKQLPPTPEALMRSRYSAFTQADVQYIAETMKGPVARQFDPEGARQWAQHVTWMGLQVVHASSVTNTDTKGTVEFIVNYRFQGKVESIHEISEFQRENGHWYYVDGKAGARAMHRNQSVKVGRNDPCPCNSGKKYKKCCGT
jgi:SEC-C motif-containing protein